MPRKKKETKAANNKGRRGNNEGSIYKRNDGRWCAQLTVGCKPDGKPLKKYIYGKTRSAVATELAKNTYFIIEDGELPQNDVSQIYFVDAFTEWFYTVKVLEISSRTFEYYTYFVKLHITPKFTGHKLEKLDENHFQNFFNELILSGKDIGSIKKIKGLISQFYTHAKKKYRIKYNPISDVKLKRRNTPKLENSKAIPIDLRPEVFEKLLNEELLRPIAMTLMFTGLRPGELIALKWEDVNFERLCINVYKAWGVDVKFDENWNVEERIPIIKNPKTELSVREFPVPSLVIETLKAWHDRQKSREAVLGKKLTEGSNFIFCTKSGEMRTYSGLQSLMQRFVEKNGWKKHELCLYSFRHTFATMLLEERENPKIVARLMEHASIITTLKIYSHVSKSLYKDSANTLDNVYNEIQLSKNNVPTPHPIP